MTDDELRDAELAKLREELRRLHATATAGTRRARWAWVKQLALILFLALLNFLGWSRVVRTLWPHARDVGAQTIGVYPSAELYWHCDFDPTTSTGVHAPIGQILFRTDAPSIYYKSTAPDTGWTQLGTGVAATPATVLSPQNFYHFEEDSTAGCGAASSGYYSNSGFTAASSCAQNEEVGSLSYWHLSTGGVAGGFILRRSVGAHGPVLLGSYAYVFRARLRIPTLSDGTNADTMEYGVSPWAGANTVLQADGIWAEYAFATNGNKWTLTTCKATVCTRSKCDGTGGTINKPIVANTWYLVEIDLNAAGTLASLAVDGVICTSSTTNLPLATTAMSPGLQQFWTLGAVARTVDHNWSTGFASVARP